MVLRSADLMSNKTELEILRNCSIRIT